MRQESNLIDRFRIGFGGIQMYSKYIKGADIMWYSWDEASLDIMNFSDKFLSNTCNNFLICLAYAMGDEIQRNPQT